MRTIITHLTPKEFFENNGKVLFSFAYSTFPYSASNLVVQEQEEYVHPNNPTYKYEEAKTLDEFNTLFDKHFHLVGSSDFIIFGGIKNDLFDENETSDFDFFEHYTYDLYIFEYDSTCFEICQGKNYVDSINIRFTDIQKEYYKKSIKEEDEAFNLDYNIAHYILPRLQKFRQNVFSYPYGFTTPEEWEKVLDKMIKAFQIISYEFLFIDYEKIMSPDKELADNEKERMEQSEKDKIEGLALFAKYFESLWK